jgi:hypothetical protein
LQKRELAQGEVPKYRSNMAAQKVSIIINRGSRRHTICYCAILRLKCKIENLMKLAG